jgi:A/G-specific adenine glycosylase
VTAVARKQLPLRPAGPDTVDALLAWYDEERRDLPWRTRRGRRADPYGVWLSEIMLQQTTVKAVIPYYLKFLARWPTVEALSRAELDDVLAAWAGLGYYSRARNLYKCAQVVAHELAGVFPQSGAELQKLPGIGPYTAAAIAAIAFGRRAVVVDANVERVVSRLFAIAEPLPASRPRIREATDSITPDRRAGDFAQAMMDLGATICTVRNPGCLACPLSAGCAAFGEGAPDAYPIKAAKKPRPQRRGTAYWLQSDGAVLLVRRPDKGMLGGMRALPGGDWGDVAELAPPIAADWRPLGTVAHVFTHFALSLDVLVAELPGRPVAGEWWPIDRIDEAGLPTLYARAATLAHAFAEEVCVS